jgi:hypothetical protein
MPKCQNPECEKEILKNMNYCSEDCLRRHIEIKEQLKEKKITTELKDESNIWAGQERRKRAMNTILKIANELCPINYEEFLANLIFRCGFTKRKLEEDYVQPLIILGFLGKNTNTIIMLKKQEFKKEKQEESQSFTEYVKEKEKQKEVKKENVK